MTRTAVAPSASAVTNSLWATAGVLSVGSVLVGLDTSLVNVGLDAIATRLDATLVQAQWVNSGYLLALAAALPLCVWSSRRVGAGRVWTWSLAAFTASSAMCAMAWDVWSLVVARVLQGAAGGLLIAAAMTILGQLADAGRMGRVVAVSSVPAILAPAAGPVVGALLISELSWRWLFLVNVPVGIVGLLLARRWIPQGERGEAKRLDVVGLVMLVPGLPIFVFGLTRVTELHSRSAVTVWATVVVGVISVVAFIRHSLRTTNPLLDLRLATDPVFAAASVEVFFAGAALFGGLVVMPLYFQLALGRGIVEAGLLLMAFSIGAAAAFPLAGWAADRFGGGIVTVVGLALSVAVTIPMALLGREPSLLVVQVLQVARGVGMALAGSPGVSSALAAVEHRRMPDASVLVNILSRVGGALGGAVVAVLLAGGDEAFPRTFWLLTVLSGIALAAGLRLAVVQRKDRA